MSGIVRPSAAAQVGRFVGTTGLTWGVVAVGLAVAAAPGLAGWLEYDRALLGAGQVWRVLTGHLSHYSGSHLLWNLLGFAVLGAICERAQPRGFIWALALSLVLIPLGLWWGAPELVAYRGLSGVTSALFGLAAAHLVRQQVRDGRPGQAWLSAACGVGFVGALAHTWLGGETLLISGYGHEVAPVPLSHAIGLVVGVALALAFDRAQEEDSPCSV